MTQELPLTIQNPTGETIIFKELIQEPDGDRLVVENYVSSKCGPPMHTHFLQDEQLTVVRGTMGYQVLGGEPQFAGAGETITFKKGVPHRFWNEGTGILHCQGWIKPANTIVFFLSSIYAAQVKSGSERPEKFDGAFLMKRYATEYDMTDIPRFVKKIIIPVTYYIGRLLGKYRHFRSAPAPLRA